MYVEHKRVIGVTARERANAVIAEELLLIEHAVQYATQSIGVGQAENAALIHTKMFLTRRVNCGGQAWHFR